MRARVSLSPATVRIAIAGANPRLLDEHGTSAFHHAINDFRLPALRLLLESEPALASFPTAAGTLPLHLAVPASTYLQKSFLGFAYIS
jgi:hypothetical protein